MVQQTHVCCAVHRTQIQRTDLLRGASLPFGRRCAQSQLLGRLHVAPVVLPAMVFIRDDPARRIRRGTNLSEMSGAIPHCTACSSIIACCTGCNCGAAESFFCAAYHCGRPSSVVTDLPSTAETGVRHDRVSMPFTRTEQEPHWPRPHPNRGPCRLRSFMRTYKSGVSGRDSIVHTRSFTRIFSSFGVAYPSFGLSFDYGDFDIDVL